jgi:hypothetical protein
MKEERVIPMMQRRCIRYFSKRSLMTKQATSSPIYNRVAIPWIVSTSHWRMLEPDEVDVWEALLIAIPEEPIKLGEVSRDASDAELGDWAIAMQQKNWQLCEEKGLCFEYAEGDRL